MKKIFTLFAAAVLGLNLYASDYKLIYNGQTLENGASYEVGYEESVEDLGEGVKIYTVKYDVNLMLQAPTTQKMTIKVTSQPEEVQFCGLDDNCQMAGAMGITKEGYTKSDAPQDLLIDIVTNDMNGYKYLEASNTVKVTAYPSDSAADATTVTITFVNKPAAEVGSVINVGNDNANAPVVYYTLLGQRLTTPPAGQIVIRCQGNSRQKVFIK